MERVYLAGWSPSRRSRPRPGCLADPSGEESLAELRDLATSASAEVAGAMLQRSPEPDPATLIGSGKAQELRIAARAAGADTLIFDHDLTPTQLRNLEQALDLKVVDRTQLILDIFAKRARTREGQLQVELAQLNYLLPRLGGRGTMLSRLGGGIGTRGPGEQKLEFDRRRIRTRIQHLQKAIEKVRAQRALHRRHRREQQFLVVALVGYTNAGKSTLFNALTQAGVTASPRLFATLDPTVRALELESRRRVLISDTVGFIRKLPTHLVASFRATLEELATADLLLHTIDASHPQYDQHEEAVSRTLTDLGLAATPVIKVWNKVDRLEGSAPEWMNGPDSVTVSALTGVGLELLRRRIDEALTSDPVVEASFELSCTDSATLALLHRSGTVLSEEIVDDRMTVRARVAASLRSRLLYQQDTRNNLIIRG